MYILDLYVVFGWKINTLLRNTHHHGVTQTVFLADSSMWSHLRKYIDFHFGSYTPEDGGSEQDTDIPVFTKRKFNPILWATWHITSDLNSLCC